MKKRFSIGIIIFIAVSAWLDLGFCQIQADEQSLKCSPNKQKNERYYSAQTKIVAVSFKVLAKGFISTTDLERLKGNIINKILSMSDESFHARYMDIYEHVYDSSFFVNKYGLYEGLTRQEAISKVKSMDKAKLIAAIDALPDDLIYDEFHRFLFKNRQEAPDANNSKRLFDSLNKMIEYLKKKYL